jgi:hypothetical protein
MSVPVKFRRHKKGPDYSLIEAIPLAAEAVGDPSKHGEGGLIGYLEYLASSHPRSFATLLARALHLQRNVGADPLQRTVGPEPVNLSNVKEMLLAKLTAMADRMPEDYVPQSPAELFALAIREGRRAENNATAGAPISSEGGHNHNGVPEIEKSPERRPQQRPLSGKSVRDATCANSISRPTDQSSDAARQFK